MQWRLVRSWSHAADQCNPLKASHLGQLDGVELAAALDQQLVPRVPRVFHAQVALDLPHVQVDARGRGAVL